MKNFRWFIIFMIFLACTINFLDRSALSYVIEPLQHQYGLSNTDFGLISSAFGLTYLFMTLVSGILVDRYGSRRIMAIFSFLWSVTSALMGLATGFYFILVLRIFLGAAESPAFPSLTRVCSDWLPERERAKAMAFSLIAVSFSSVVGAPFITQLITHFGWRWMFVILGAIGIIWALVWYLIFSDHPKDSQILNTDEKQYILSHQKHHPSHNMHFSLFALFQKPSLWMGYIAYFCLGYLLSFAISWLPGYFQQVFHLSIREIGYWLMIPWLTATLMIILGGSISDWVWVKTQNIRSSRSMLICLSQLLSAVFWIPVVLSHSFYISLLFISLGLGFGLLPMSAFYSLNADLVHKQAAKSQGIMSGFLGLASFIAPALTGFLASQYGDFSKAILVLVLLPLLSGLMIFFYHKPDTCFDKMYEPQL